MFYHLFVRGKVGQAGAQHGQTQKLENIRAYLTESDWAVLASPQMTPEYKLGRLVDRIVALGCRHPSCKTVGAMVAVMACCHSSSPQHLSADVLYSWVLEAKDQLESRRSPTAAAAEAEVIKVYPLSPSELDRPLYPKGEVPVPRDLPKYQQVFKKVPFFWTREAK